MTVCTSGSGKVCSCRGQQTAKLLLLEKIEISCLNIMNIQIANLCWCYCIGWVWRQLLLSELAPSSTLSSLALCWCLEHEVILNPKATWSTYMETLEGFIIGVTKFTLDKSWLWLFCVSLFPSKKRALIPGKTTNVNEMAQKQLLYLALRHTSSLCLHMGLISIQDFRYLHRRKAIRFLGWQKKCLREITV